ncbi:MAG: hypothetical protein NVS3B28_08260 [Candidatus Velthaea sp.]
MQADSVENIFARSWNLLARNPAILIPGIVVGIAVGIIQFFVVPPVDVSGDPAALNLAGRAFGALMMLAVGVLAYLVTQAYTVGMAGAAWQRGTTDLADGARAFADDAARLFGTLILLAVVGIVVALLTFGIGWPIFLFFAIYTVPAVVLSNLSPVSALRQSFSIATKRFVPTLIIIVLLVVISVLAGVVTLPLHFIPLLGPIIGAIITQAIVAYSTLVIVGEYLSVRNAPDAGVV